MTHEVAEAIERSRRRKKANLAERFADACQHAFEMGLFQEKRTSLKYNELIEKVDWIRGQYKETLWRCYKSGLWTRDNP
jgi:hypothetical protein